MQVIPLTQVRRQTVEETGNISPRPWPNSKLINRYNPNTPFRPFNTFPDSQRKPVCTIRTAGNCGGLSYSIYRSW
jgi:hypothetical protein